MKEHTNILLVDDDDSSREALSLLLKATGYTVTPAASGQEAIHHLERNLFDLVITDLFLPDVNGLDILRNAKEQAPEMEVVVITGNASADTAVRAMKQGAYDYITKPLNIDELRIVIAKALEKRQLLSENVYLKKQLRDRYEFSNIIGTSEAMQSVFNLMKRIIKTDSTVLVMGESGTGKEIVAKAIHFNSHRKDKPFIAVHCGAIPETLLESELFGHTRGSFTGAHKDKIGKFEAAHGGTIFLDEIGTMPLQLQTKLLRVLQEQEVEKVGSTKPIKIDIRVISATNQHLAEEVKRGNFREDLYYRLNVIPLNMPPLRERKADILPLVRHFMAKYCTEMERPLLTLTRDALEALECYDWPGNVRELENVVERTVALTEGEQITREDLPSNISTVVPTVAPTAPHVTSAGVDMMKTVEEIERQMIGEALALSGGVKARAAALLQLNRTTLVEKMRRLGMALMVVVCILVLARGSVHAGTAYDTCRQEEQKLREQEADNCSGFAKLLNPSGCIAVQNALQEYEAGKCWKLGGIEKTTKRPLPPLPVTNDPATIVPSAQEGAPATTPPTIAELQAENDRLKAENRRLQAEIERLRGAK